MTYKILYSKPDTPAEITRLETKALSTALEKAGAISRQYPTTQVKIFYGSPIEGQSGFISIFENGETAYSW